MYWLYHTPDEMGGGAFPWPPYSERLLEMPVKHNREPIYRLNDEVLKGWREELKHIDGIVYKYRDAGNQYHFAILDTGELWVPSFPSLNDPYDGNISVRFNYDNEESKANLMKFNKREIREAISLTAPKMLTGRALKRTIRWIGGLRGSNLWEAKFANARQFIARHCCGVSCFSGDPMNKLMWSHYANSHSGICIGFDKQLLLIDVMRQTRSAVWGEINYSDSFGTHSVPKHEVDFLIGMLMTKGAEWSYEKEFRILTQVLCGKSIELSPGTITEVTLGSNIDKDGKDKVIDTCRRKWPQASLYQAKRGAGFEFERFPVLA